MKKSIIGLTLIFWTILTLPVWASSCDGGVEVTGKNGHVYCKSKVTMNWYTAFTWCDAHGRKLASLEQMCDIDETQQWAGGYNKCLNMVDSFSGCVWSAIPSSSSSSAAWYVCLPEGGVNVTNRLIAGGYNALPALCW